MIIENNSTPARRSDRPSVERFVRSANLCRTRGLEQLVILSELMRALSELIHALQKERGAASIFLGSTGTQFAACLNERVGDCQVLEQAVREQLERLGDGFERMSCGARFYTCVVLALRALGTLPDLRNEIISLRTAPQDSIKAFIDVIGALLAVGYEIGEVATDPQVSRAVLALANFAQAKEYAGQERATGGASISSGRFTAEDLQRLRHLIAAQEQAFGIFAEFADRPFIDALNETLNSRDAAAVQQMRTVARQCSAGEPAGVSADDWYRHTTQRIDGLRVIETRLAEELARLCALKLRAAHGDGAGAEAAGSQAISGTAAIAVLFAEADPARQAPGIERGIGLYFLDPSVPTPMRSILSVVETQSRRIHDVSTQLESARAALAERKLVDRAKGLLMESRGIAERAAYALMREAAMRQNKRIVQIAEAIISTAEILKA